MNTLARIDKLIATGYGVHMSWRGDYWLFHIDREPRGVEICRGNGVTLHQAVTDAMTKLRSIKEAR